MKAFIFSLFSFTLFLSCFCQNIQVLLPSTLRTWVSASGITDGLATTIMPFGHIPWGRKVQGRLVLANPTNACDMITIEDKPKKAFILVAQRDDCDLYIKAQNAEKTGARMLIITDNTGNGPSEIKLPPNSIGPINIPTVIVKKAVGDLLLEALNIDDEEFSNIIASLDFPVTRLDNPEYVVGISSGNRESYRFLKEWEQYYKLLLPGTIVTEQGVFYKDPFISMKVTYLHKGYINQESKVNRSRDCACSGYCVPLEYKDSPANGSDLIKEDLRQICLYYDDDGKYRNKWWQYVIAYGDLCFDNAKVEECSSKIMRSLDIDATKVAACVDASWNNCANTILDQKKFSYYRQSAAAEMGISLGDFKIVPSVSIEQMWINNTRPAIGLFEYLCQVAGTMPEKCVGMFDTTMINPNLNKGTPPGELRSNVDVPGPSKLESESKSDSRSQSATGPKSETQAEMSKNQKESSGSQGYVLLMIFALILTGLFFWRRHAKRTNYQTVEESPSGVA